MVSIIPNTIIWFGRPGIMGAAHRLAFQFGPGICCPPGGDRLAVPCSQARRTHAVYLGGAQACRGVSGGVGVVPGGAGRLSLDRGEPGGSLAQDRSSLRHS